MAVDPSQNVHGELLPHVHLLSTFRYPLLPRVDLQDVTKWLLGAPKIARDTAPFFWTYLDCPQDGSVYLTWQPTARRGIEFASDGYVWAGAEVYFRNDVGNGLTLEIYYQRCGYRPGETVAAHSRRRFRLSPSQGATQNIPQVDPNLWIVHYGPSEKNERPPVSMVPITPPMHHMLGVRQQLFQMGQIARKEFILSDRVNWPHIPLPPRGQALFAPPMPARNVPQAMAYPPHPPPAVGPTPKRRGGHGQGAAHPPQMMGAPFPGMDSIFDDDEDISRGDMFDHLTPQEVSIHRYQQNHEWMEEILSSPYRIGQIEVADLGLGRKGELASLTDGIFEAQSSETWETGPKKPYTGHLDPALAAEFRKRVEAKTAALTAEVAALKVEHANVKEKFATNSMVKQAEQDLRLFGDDAGFDLWPHDDRQEDGEGFNRPSPDDAKKSQDILARVEAVVGKRAVVVPVVDRVQEGGYIEPVPEPELPQPPLRTQADLVAAGASASMSRQPSHAGSQASGVMVGDSDIDMGGTAAGLLDQMHTGFSSTSTPVNNFPTPQLHHLSAIPSSAATPANLNVPSPIPAQAPTSQPPVASSDDVRMEDADAARNHGTAPDQGTGSGEWVVVPKGGVSPGSSGLQAGTAMAGPEAVGSKVASAAHTPGDNDFSSLGDLDTAADALAGYDPPSVDAGGLGDLGMDMDDSAFGDAFHGVEQSADTPADGM